MKMIKAVVEGQTEARFVNEVLSPYFLELGKMVLPITILTKKDESSGRMHKGGVSRYSKIRKTLLPVLKSAQNSNDVYVTTMIDFYGLPKDTPGYAEAAKLSDPYQKVQCLEAAILERERPAKPIFLPYIQLHEFEALLFTDLSKLEAAYFKSDLSPLKQCAATFRNPELINNSRETAPSKRIQNCIGKGFDKVTVGVDVAREIGLDMLRTHCAHFNAWVE